MVAVLGGIKMKIELEKEEIKEITMLLVDTTKKINDRGMLRTKKETKRLEIYQNILIKILQNNESD